VPHERVAHASTGLRTFPQFTVQHVNKRGGQFCLHHGRFANPGVPQKNHLQEHLLDNPNGMWVVHTSTSVCAKLQRAHGEWGVRTGEQRCTDPHGVGGHGGRGRGGCTRIPPHNTHTHTWSALPPTRAGVLCTGCTRAPWSEMPQRPCGTAMRSLVDFKVYRRDFDDRALSLAER
jgi:hypothetical protein